VPKNTNPINKAKRNTKLIMHTPVGEPSGLQAQRKEAQRDLNKHQTIFYRVVICLMYGCLELKHHGTSLVFFPPSHVSFVRLKPHLRGF
jgi:hypothetical protein